MDVNPSGDLEGKWSGGPSQVLSTLGRSVFYISLPFGILHFGLPIFGKEIGADAVQIGLFFSAFSVMTVLLRPFVGWGLDRFGRRPFFIAGAVGYAVAMFAFAFIQQAWGIVVARAFQGVASSFFWLSAQAITADTAEEAGRGRAFGRVGQASERGGIVGTFVGIAVLTGALWPVAEYVGGNWTLLFLSYGVVGLGATVYAWRRLPETNPTVQLDQRPQPIAWSRAWVLLLLVTLVTAASWTMISPILMIFLQDKLAVGVMELAWAYLPAALVWAVLPAHLGRLADRFGRKPLMVLGMAVAAVSSFIIPGLGSLVALAALWALQALCFAAGDPAEQALVADLTGGDQRGRAYGLYAGAAGLGATFGPLVGGWLYERVATQAPFYANGVILALSTLVLAGLLQEPAKEIEAQFQRSN